MITSPSIIPLIAGFTPADLTSKKPMIDVKISKQQNKIWQDSGRTILSQNDGDPVYNIQCPYTGFIYTTFSNTYRPTLKTDGVRWWIRFSGSSNYLFISGLVWGSTVGSSSVAIKPISGLQCPIQLFNSSSSTDDILWYTNNQSYALNFRTSRIDSYRTVVPDTNLHLYSQISGSGTNTYKVFDNGVNVLTANPSWNSPTDINIGKGISNLYSNMDLYGAIIDGSAWDDTTRQNVESYLTSLAL